MDSVPDLCTKAEEQLLAMVICRAEGNDENWQIIVDNLCEVGLQETLELYQQAYDE